MPKIADSEEYLYSIANQMSEEAQQVFVTQSFYNIKYIKNPSENVQFAAVSFDSACIIWIQSPSELIQLMAVRMDIYNIVGIDKPTPVVQMEAVKQFIENYANCMIDVHAYNMLKDHLTDKAAKNKLENYFNMKIACE